MTTGAVLDVPAGGAVQSRALKNLGYRVFSIDLFEPQKRVDGTSWICADANRALPFRDAAFDYVLSREGIEHLEDQMGFLRNCARVLKPGGRIVLTTPNMMHLAARASGFLTGQRNLRREKIDRKNPVAEILKRLRLHRAARGNVEHRASRHRAEESLDASPPPYNNVALNWRRSGAGQ